MPEKNSTMNSEEFQEPEQHRKLFIGGLTFSTTEDNLREFYGKWGEIVDCIVMRDQSTKRSRGFGFVTYSGAGMVDESMKNRPHVIDGKTIEPKRAIPRNMSARPETNMSVRRLYVSGVREEHTVEMFKEYFADFGDVIEVDIMTDRETGKPRGFAFVTFGDYDAVDKCVLKRSHMIADKRCDVKKALSKDEMKKAQQQERDRYERDGRSRGMDRGRGGWGGGYQVGGGGYPGGGGGYPGGGGDYQSGNGGWSQNGGWNQGGGRGGWGGGGGSRGGGVWNSGGGWNQETGGGNGGGYNQGRGGGGGVGGGYGGGYTNSSTVPPQGGGGGYVGQGGWGTQGNQGGWGSQGVNGGGQSGWSNSNGVGGGGPWNQNANVPPTAGNGSHGWGQQQSGSPAQPQQPQQQQWENQSQSQPQPQQGQNQWPQQSSPSSGGYGAQWGNGGVNR